MKYLQNKIWKINKRGGLLFGTGKYTERTFWVQYWHNSHFLFRCFVFPDRFRPKKKTHDRHAGDEKNLHSGGRKFIFFHRFSRDILFSVFVSFAFFIVIFLALVLQQGLQHATLTLPGPYISESRIKTKINLSFYFHTSLWHLKSFYEGF